MKKSENASRNALKHFLLLEILGDSLREYPLEEERKLQKANYL